MDILRKYLNSENQEIYKPEYFRLQNLEDKKKFEKLLTTGIAFFAHDEIDGQIRELVKCMNPHLRIKDEDYPALVTKHLNGCSIDDYGVWIYYPWSHKIIHILDEDEFIEVRTNRNKYKLTTEEQKYLAGKKIGIIGLSVGQSIALTIAMERICGELRLADFDTAELSNLNRIRTGLYNLGVKKTIIAAREIAEIDPFIKVEIFSDGLHKDNMETFFTGNGKLDLLVEVCDGLDIKIQSRFKARELGIPVVMDTNDRGMMDIERFDLEPDRPILHGLAGDLNPDNIKDLSNEQKIPYIFKMVGIDTLSTRLKASMIEVSQSINTWPQLASSVVLGGALTTDVSRRILLDQFHDSGRYYIDIDELIADKEGMVVTAESKIHTIEDAEMEHIAWQYFNIHPTVPAHIPVDTDINKIIDAAAQAPSYNDIKYWSSYYTKGTLFIFTINNNSSWDDSMLGGYTAIGGAFENIHLQASSLLLKEQVHLFPLAGEKKLVAAITFGAAKNNDSQYKILSENIYVNAVENQSKKHTAIPLDFFNNLQYFVKPGDNIELHYTNKIEDINVLAGVIGASHRLQLLDENGHGDFYDNIHWGENSDDKRHVSKLGFSDGEIAGYSVAKDWKAVNYLSKWDKGNVFRLMATHKAAQAAAMLSVVVKSNDTQAYLQAGQVMERIILYCRSLGITAQVQYAPTLVWNKLNSGLKKDKEKEVNDIRDGLFKIFPLDKAYGRDTQVFLMKLALPAMVNT